MKVIIINPPPWQNKEYIREGRCMQTKSSWAALWMPLSLAYVAGFLRKNGHQVQLIDCIGDKISLGSLLKRIEKFSPQLAIINTAFPSIKGDLKTIASIKNAFPQIKTLAIGMYPTLLEKKVLEELPQLDMAISGEPEWVCLKVANSLEKGNSLDKIKGLVYKKNSKIFVNPPQNFQENNLDELPFPARDLLNNENYRLPTTGEKFTLLSVGRGCPFNCIFCTANIYYGKIFRKRKIESIIEELKECVEKYNIKNFLFWGENFTLDQTYGEKICDAILESNLKINWATTSRVDTLNERLLKKMKKAGCILLGLGIESIDQEILNNAKKEANLTQIKKAINLTKKIGLETVGHFIFGLPGDTKKTAKKTIKFACQSGLTWAHFYCAIPYPKTELGKIAEERNWILSKDFSQYDLTKSVMRNEVLTPKEIKKLRDTAYLKFYFRPKVIFRALKEVKSIKSLLSSLNFLNWIKS